MTETTVAIPGLAKGYGYWVTVTTTASGPVLATWATPVVVQGTLKIYAGNPFAAGSNPVKRSPPSGALATQSAKRAAFSVATGTRPAGTYTAYFYAGGAVAASTGTVTGMR
jgi:hypothetical protein